jgi:hypothetical protein
MVLKHPVKNDQVAVQVVDDFVFRDGFLKNTQAAPANTSQ